MRDEGVPPPGHAKAWAFQQMKAHLRCGPAPLREDRQRLQINLGQIKLACSRTTRNHFATKGTKLTKRL